MNTESGFKKKLAAAALTLLAVFCAICLGCFSALVYQAAVCSRLIKTLPVPELHPLLFVLHGTGTDTVSARFRLTDADGHKIALIERSWNGSDLYIEFASLRLGKKKLVLPRRVYTEEAKNHSEYFGTYLPRYYMTAEKCLFFSGTDEDPDLQRDLARLSRYTLSRFRLPLFGLRRERLVVPLNGYERGVSWGVTIAGDGSLIIAEE